jgi:23S rRNA (cytosine1962-C5)-methyltransferase
MYVSPAAERALRDGHPWLFEKSLRKQSHDGEPGDLAVLFDRKGRFLALGIYDPLSVIRVRVLQHGEPGTIGANWFEERIKVATRLRLPLENSGTSAFRLVHGENDGLPGVVIDKYEQTYVVKLYSVAWLPHLRTLLSALEAIAGPERVVLRLSRAVSGNQSRLFGLRDGDTLLGSPPTDPIRFLENGLRFEADVIRGQKTGFFLDQRENRWRAEGMANGKTVLNLFAYSGGFSLYAARGGANEVTSLDISQPALRAAERNFALNQTDPHVAAATHRTLRGDAFELLSEMQHSHQHYGMVIVDPPPFARKASEVPRALSSYRRLVRLALAVLRPAGTLVISSCSSRVAAEAFFQLVNQEAAQVGRPLHELERTYHPVDHPIRFKFGSYLKCLFAEAS